MEQYNNPIDSVKLNLNQMKQQIRNQSENTSFLTEMLERIEYLEHEVKKIEMWQQSQREIQLVMASAQQRLDILKISSSKEELCYWLIDAQLDEDPFAHHVAKMGNKNLLEETLELVHTLPNNDQFRFFSTCNADGATYGHCLLQNSKRSIECITAYLDSLKKFSEDQQVGILTTQDKNSKNIGKLIVDRALGLDALTAYLNHIECLSSEVQSKLLSSFSEQLLYEFDRAKVTAYFIYLNNFPPDIKESILNVPSFDYQKICWSSLDGRDESLSPYLDLINQLPREIQMKVISSLGYFLSYQILLRKNDCQGKSIDFLVDYFRGYLEYIKTRSLEIQQTIFFLEHVEQRVKRGTKKYGNRSIIQNIKGASVLTYPVFLSYLRFADKEIQKKMLIDYDIFYPTKESFDDYLYIVKNFSDQERETLISRYYPGRIDAMIRKITDYLISHIVDNGLSKHKCQILCELFIYLGEDNILVKTDEKDFRDVLIAYIKTIKDQEELVKIIRLARSPNSALHKYLITPVKIESIFTDHTYLDAINNIKIEDPTAGKSNLFTLFSPSDNNSDNSSDNVPKNDSKTSGVGLRRRHKS